MLSVMRAAAVWMESLREVGIAGRRLHLGVPEQFPNHSQALAESQRARGKAMAQIVDSARPQGPPACGCAAKGVAGR